MIILYGAYILSSVLALQVSLKLTYEITVDIYEGFPLVLLRPSSILRLPLELFGPCCIVRLRSYHHDTTSTLDQLALLTTLYKVFSIFKETKEKNLLARKWIDL